MTISRKPARCDWCGGEFAASEGPGRPARYCRRSHRQRAYEARRLASERGLGHDEVILSRRSWEQLRDALYILESANEDVAMDVVSGRASKAEYVEALRHLSAAAQAVQSVPIEPTAVGGD